MSLRAICAGCAPRRVWTQEELADKADMDRTYLSRLERGAYSPTIDMVAKIAGAFGVDPASMLKP